MTFNNDTGSNYALRRSIDGAADGTLTSQSLIKCESSEIVEDLFFNMFIINNASNEKLTIMHANYNSATGAATAPRRHEYFGKWANTSDQITEIDIDNASGGSYDTNTILKVWGSD
jgi:hypothetical protein